MKGLLIAILILGSLATSVWADVVKGKLEKVNSKSHEIIVGSVKVKTARDVTIFGEDEMKRDHTMSIKALIPYIGYRVYCRGREDEKEGFVADFIKVYMYR